jgi:hypothetical protein
MSDVPVDQLLKLAHETVQTFGGRVYFSFTCAGCGRRLTFDEPNTLYSHGLCDRCGTTTVITEGGFDLECDTETATAH